MIFPVIIGQLCNVYKYIACLIHVKTYLPISNENVPLLLMPSAFPTQNKKKVCALERNGRYSDPSLNELAQEKELW